jgi:YHYH protein
MNDVFSIMGWGALTAAICIVLVGLCGGAAIAQEKVSTVDGIKAAKWSGKVRITINQDTFRFESNGLPNHGLPDQYLIPANGVPPGQGTDADFKIVDTRDLLMQTPVDVTITLHPVYSKTTQPTDLGMIGVIISGSRLFNDYEDPERKVVALDDNRRIGKAAFIDDCNAHPLQNGHSYHYHGVPECILNAGDAGNHSPIIGVLLDGFPIYGNKGPNGKNMTNADLDECAGHFGPTPEFPEGIYHYHLTSDKAPYSIDCYHGEIDTSWLGQTWQWLKRLLASN